MDYEKRPTSITAFEVINILSLIVEMVLTESDSPIGDFFMSALWLALVLWITRGRSKAGRITYTGVMGIGVAALVAAFSYGFLTLADPWTIAWLTAELGLLMALLWWPSTTRWLAGRRGPAAAG